MLAFRPVQPIPQRVSLVGRNQPKTRPIRQSLPVPLCLSLSPSNWPPSEQDSRHCSSLTPSLSLPLHFPAQCLFPFCPLSLLLFPIFLPSLLLVNVLSTGLPSIYHDGSVAHIHTYAAFAVGENQHFSIFSFHQQFLSRPTIEFYKLATTASLINRIAVAYILIHSRFLAKIKTTHHQMII